MAIPLHIKLDEVASTNEFATFYLTKTKPPEGSVISADNQHNGRGQVGRSWHSSPGKNVQMSVLLYPEKLGVAHQFYLNIILSLAIFDLVEAHCPQNQVFIKWPNDIYIENKKVCGLLIQLAISGNRIQNAVLGVGLNVFEQDFPKNLPNPTSLSMHSTKLPAISTFIEEIQHRIMHYYRELYAGKADALKVHYESKLYKRHEMSTFSTPEGARFKGNLQGVDGHGRMVIFLNGSLKSFSMSELRMVV